MAKVAQHPLHQHFVGAMTAGRERQAVVLGLVMSTLGSLKGEPQHIVGQMLAQHTQGPAQQPLV